MTGQRIRVLLVEDSPTCLAILQRMLSTSPDIEMVGTAKHGKDALDLIPKVDPSVICTDLEMPVMNGLEFTKEVMARDPRPILVVSNYVQHEDTENVFRLLEVGAVDVFPKPRGGNEADLQLLTEELVLKIKVLSGVHVIRRRAVRPQPVAPSRELPPSSKKARAYRLLLIGASTGGPQALHSLLAQFPAEFPLPLVCVQHVSTGFLQALVEWLSGSCQVKVKVAEPGEAPAAGTVYFPVERKHLELDQEGRFVVSAAPPIEGHRPSVDITFKSAARVHGDGAIGVLLTGMGRDGAEGLLAIAEAGGVTIAQDEQTSVVFGMPQEAIKLGAASQVLPLGEIAPALMKTVIQ